MRSVTHGAGGDGPRGHRSPRPVALCASVLCAVALMAGAGNAQADSRYSLTHSPAASGTGDAPALERSTGGDAEVVAEATGSRGFLPDLVSLPLLAGAAPATAEQAPDSRYRLTVRSEGDRVRDYEGGSGSGFTSARMFEAAGGYYQDLGLGFGYGLNLGLGMETRSGWDDLGTDGETTSYFTDLSFGPTFASGRLDSQFRIGVRRPLGGDDLSALGFGHGDRHRELGRTAGYLSLDGRLQLQNESELSLSLYYDNYSLNEGTAEDWLEDRLEFEGATSDAPSSVFGVEMGLTF